MRDVISNVSTPTTQWSRQCRYMEPHTYLTQPTTTTVGRSRSSKYEMGPHAPRCWLVSLPIFEGLCWRESLL